MAVIDRRMVHVIAAKNAADVLFRQIASNLREHDAVETMAAHGAPRRRSLDATFDTVIGRWRRPCGQFMRATLVSQGNVLTAPVIDSATRFAVLHD